MPKKEIYIVISRTGSVVSSIIKEFTHAEYNHVSVSLDPALNVMYSFGRWNAYFPWIGGFVEESPHFGTLKRFPETEVIVLAIPIKDDTYNNIQKRLAEMLAEKYSYPYDMIGLLFAAINIIYHRKNHFYCSEFVRSLLVAYKIASEDVFPPIIRPMDFLDMPNSREIYRGKLIDFPTVKAEVSA